MKRKGKSVFFIVAAVILALVYCTLFGLTTTYGDIQTTRIKSVRDIRWGLDVQGGVEAIFTPADELVPTPAEMETAASVLKSRLADRGATDYQVYVDNEAHRIIVRFPQEIDIDPAQTILALSETAMLTFREGIEMDQLTGVPTGVTAEKVILEGSDVGSAQVGMSGEDEQYIVLLTLTSAGTEKFAEATGRLLGQVISIWMDETPLSAPTVNSVISDGNIMIQGNFTQEQAFELATQINTGALPFPVVTESQSTIAPTWGTGAQDVILLAGGVALLVAALLLIIRYRLSGLVAAFTLLGQLSLILAVVTGFFGPFPAFTLTWPGIAGILLALSLGIDANCINSERIKDELAAGKSVESSVASGLKRASSSILDSHIALMIGAIVLMAAFGVSNNLFVVLLSPIFRWFGQTAGGAIYAFSFTLLAGLALNVITGVLASRLMLTSLARYQGLKKPWLYGGVNQ